VRCELHQFVGMRGHTGRNEQEDRKDSKEPATDRHGADHILWYPAVGWHTPHLIQP
jgi:hypothetical protein